MISINDDRFLAVDTLIDIDKDMEINLSLVEKITAPYNLSVDFSYRDTDKKTDVLFRWNQDLGWSDSFEEYDDLRPNSVAGPLSIKIVCVLTV